MAGRNWAAYPDQTTGYQRGVARSNTEEKGSGMGASVGTSGSSSWHPTVKFLLALVIGEIVAYGALRAYTKHGG
jgi:hypothetical protein